VLDRLSIAGWVGAIVFGAWTLFESVKQPPNPVAPVTTENPTKASVELPELDVVPPELEDLRITLDRPLFNASRRPEELAPNTTVSSPTEPEPVKAPPLRLSAVIVDERGRSALLEPVETRVVQRVQEGENIAGWRLVEVREDAVILASGGKRTEVALRVFDAPPPVAARAPPNQRATRNKRPSRQPGSARSRAQAAARTAKDRAKKIEQARRDGE